MNSFIKIKMLSLGAEIKLIHREERKWLKRSRRCAQLLKTPTNQPERKASLPEWEAHARANFWGLREHHRGLRPEARIANLAYGFVRGIPYKKLENKAYTAPNWAKVAGLVQRYGEGFRDADAKLLIERWSKET